MPITAAITAGIGAVGSIGSSLIGSNASNKASQQQVAMQQQALAVQQGMFNTAKDTIQPFVNAGTSVLPTLQGLLTPGTSAATLATMPGFQFQSQYGTKAATNALTASGRGSGGPLATAISNYNNGLAGTTWQNTVGALQNFANMGSSSANALASGALNSGNSQAATLTGIGTSQAAGTLGSANALTNGISGVTGGVQNALLYKQLLGSGGGGGGLYSGLTSGEAPSNSAISNASESDIANYENMFG